MKIPNLILSAALLAVTIGVLFGDEKKPPTIVSGVIYADYYYNMTEGIAPGSVDAFELTRLYLKVSRQASERISMKAVIEGNQVGTSAAGAIFVKNAFTEYKDIIKGSNLRFGVIGTPWIGYEESIWKNRFMAKTFTDIEGLMPSADKGIGLSGRVSGKLINYDLIVVNGEGYNNAPEVNKDKDFAARASVEIADGLKGQLFNLTGKEQAASLDRNRTIFGLSYEKNELSAMAYSLSAKNGDINKSGFSAFTNYKLFSKLTAVARYDLFDQDTDSAKNSWTRIIAGVVVPIEDSMILGFDVQQKNFEDASQGNDQMVLYTHVGVSF